MGGRPDTFGLQYPEGEHAALSAAPLKECRYLCGRPELSQSSRCYSARGRFVCPFALSQKCSPHTNLPFDHQMWDVAECDVQFCTDRHAWRNGVCNIASSRVVALCLPHTWPASSERDGADSLCKRNHCALVSVTTK